MTAQLDMDDELLRHVHPGFLYEGPAKGEFGKGWYVPVMDGEGSLRLVDTNVLQSPSMRNGESQTDAAIRNAIELSESDHSYCLYRIRADYYHGGDYIVSPERGSGRDATGSYALPHGFETVCDLHGFRARAACEDTRCFESRDVVRGAILYHEHGYSWTRGFIGVTLVRKGAVESPLLVLQAKVDDAISAQTGPRSAWFRANDVNKALEAVDFEREELKAGAKAVELARMRLKHWREGEEVLRRWEAEWEVMSARHNDERMALERGESDE